MYLIPDSTQSKTLIGVATGVAAVMFGSTLLGTGSAYPVSRAEAWRSHIQPRALFIVDARPESVSSAQRPDVRTASEHIENIRAVLNPPVADLAIMFDVSRQAIYKWLAGNSTPEEDKLDRITELSRIAGEFQSAGVSRAGTMLKMKAFGGRSLMDLIKSGESRQEHVDALIAEAQVMESSYKQSGLATTKSRSDSDWQSSVSIPGYSEHI